MNISFNRVTIDGFMSFNHEELDLLGLGLVTIKGTNKYEPLAASNGSGKSAISESLLWCLTGSTSRGATDVANNLLNKGVYVKVDLNIDDTNYIITRSKNHCDLGTCLNIIKNGEDISGNTVTKSKTILEAEFSSSLDYDTLTSIIILSQGLPSRLSTLKPSSRKSRLEELSKTDHYVDDLQSKVADAHSRISNQIADIRSKITACSTRITTSEITISTNQGKIDEINRKASGLISKDEADRLIATMPDLQDEIDQITANWREKSSQLSQILSEKSALSGEFSQKRGANEQYLSQYSSLHAAVCPTCNQVIQNQVNLEAMRLHLNDQMGQNKQRLIEIQTKLNELEPQSIQLAGDISLLQEEESTKKAELQEMIKQYSDYKSFSSSTTILEEGIQDAKDTITIETANRTQLESELATLEEKLAICNYLKNQLSRKFRSFLLEGVISYMNQKCAEYSPYLFEKQGLVSLEIDGNNINIYLGGRRFEDLSGGEGRRVDIILQLAQRDLARNESGFTSNLLVLDEILDNLDAVGADSVIRLLDYKSPDVGTMLIVSHKQDITIPSDGIISVVKGMDQISHIAKSGD